MKTTKAFILGMTALLILGLGACGFKHAEDAKTSMHGVHESAEDLKDETETSKQKTEDIKEQEAQDSVQGHQW